MARRRMNWQSRLMLAVLMGAAVVFLPTTTLLVVGMLPTAAARLADRSREKTKTLTVGFMNFAGCFPFLYNLFIMGHTFENAMSILSNPLTIVIMYAAAAIGYAIEWGVASFVAGLMVHKGRKRLETIKKAQENLARQWGQEVSGEIPLDQYGFPLDQK